MALLTSYDMDKGTNIPNDWVLVIHSLKARPMDNIQAYVNDTKKRLVPVYPQPFKFTLDGFPYHVCAYSLPEDPQVNALMYFVGDSPHSNAKLNLMQLTKQFFGTA